MPPKPKVAAPKPVEDDLAEVASLPPIASFLFAPLFQQFRLKSRRSQLEQGLQGFITGGEQPFRAMTRDDIMTSGKTRGIFNDPEGNELSEDQLTPALFAKAAKAKILELSLPFMRSRRDKILKLEEQAKTAAE